MRIISATNVEMEANIEKKRFRNDLYFRLNDVTISLPPLRARMDDLPLLYHAFMKRYAPQFGKEPVPLTAEIEQDLSNYSWPGNVRELESFVKRMMVLGYENALRQLKGAGAFSTPLKPPVDDASGPQASPPLEPGSCSLKQIAQEAVTEAEKAAIRQALEQTKWNKKRAAALLGVSYRSLLYKVKEYEI